MKYADLHIHTTFSDGRCTPQEVVNLAQEKGLSCIAITDHDAAGGITPALKEAGGLGIEVVPGVELSAEKDGYELHILGYFIDWQEKWFQDKLLHLRQVRQRRALAIIDKLRARGMNLNSEQLLAAGHGCVGRLHIAKILKDKGYVSSVQAAFDQYIGNSGPCYVKKLRLTPDEAIKIIRRLRGVAVLAHPYCIGNDELIGESVKLGLRGIEVYYPEHNQSTSEHYRNLAQQYGLLMSGGSDYHGVEKNKADMGEVKVDYSLVEALKREAARA